jgi:hypothetical protein
MSPGVVVVLCGELIATRSTFLEGLTAKPLEHQGSGAPMPISGVTTLQECGSIGRSGGAV